MKYKHYGDVWVYEMAEVNLTVRKHLHAAYHIQNIIDDFDVLCDRSINPLAPHNTTIQKICVIGVVWVDQKSHSILWRITVNGVEVIFDNTPPFLILIRLMNMLCQSSK